MDRNRYYHLRSPLVSPLGYALVFPVVDVNGGIVGHVTQLLFSLASAASTVAEFTGVGRQHLFPISQNAVGISDLEAVIAERLFGITQSAEGGANNGKLAQHLFRISESAVGGANNGRLAQTLHRIIESATAKETIGLSAMQQLHLIVQNAQGSSRLAADVMETLFLITQGATGHVQQDARLAQSLYGILQEADGLSLKIRVAQVLHRLVQDAEGGANNGIVTQQLFMIRQFIGSFLNYAQAEQTLMMFRQRVVAGMESFGDVAEKLQGIKVQSAHGVITAEGAIHEILKALTQKVTSQFILSSGPVMQALSGLKIHAQVTVLDNYGSVHQQLTALTQALNANRGATAHAAMTIARPIVVQITATNIPNSWGSVAQRLLKPTQAAAGFEHPMGSAAQHLLPIKESITAAQSYGYGVQQLLGVSQSVNARMLREGAVSQQLGMLTQAALGGYRVGGGISQQLLNLVQSAAAYNVANYGSALQRLSPIAQNALATLVATGHVSQHLARLVQDLVANVPYGSSTQMLFPVFQEADGDVSPAAIVAQALFAIVQEADGVVPYGYGAQMLFAAVQNVQAVQHARGQVRMSLQKAIIHAVGASPGTIAQMLFPISQALGGSMESFGPVMQRMFPIGQSVGADVSRTGVSQQVLYGIRQSLTGTEIPRRTGAVISRLKLITQRAIAKDSYPGAVTVSLHGPYFKIVALEKNTATSHMQLSRISQSLAGVESHPAHISQMLTKLSQTLAASMPRVGAVVQTLPGVKQSAAAKEFMLGNTAELLRGIFQGSGGLVYNDGRAEQHLFGITQGGTGWGQIVGHSGMVLAKAINVVNGFIPSAGPIVQSLHGISESAAGTMIPRRVGTMAQTLTKVSQGATGNMTPNNWGAAAQTLTMVKQAGTGLFIPPRIGTMAQTLTKVKQGAVGTETDPANFGPVVQTLVKAFNTADGLVAQGIHIGAAQMLSKVSQSAAGLFAPDVNAAVAQRLTKPSQSVSGRFIANAGRIAQTRVGINQSAGGVVGARGGVSQTLNMLYGTTLGNIGAAGGIDEEKMIPNGRLTLQTATPWLSTAVTNGTTLFYTPAIGNTMYYWSGALWAADTSFSEISQLLTDATASPAAAAANKVYDVFVWKNGTTATLSRGPAWPSSYNRGTGAGSSELKMQAGFFVNANAITNGPAANYGMYIGTVQTNAAGTVSWSYAMDFNTSQRSTVFNAFNTRQIMVSTYDQMAYSNDPYWSNVELLLTANSDGTFTDKSQSAHTFIKTGTVNSVLTNSQFGNYVMDFTGGTTIGLSDITSSSDYALLRAGQTWTVDFWMYPTSTPATGWIFSNQPSGGSGTLFGYNSSVLKLFSRNSSSGNTIYTTAIAPPLNKWTHVAIQYEGNVVAGQIISVFINGQSVLQVFSPTLNDAATDVLCIGNLMATTGATPVLESGHSFQGYLDQFRITRGVLRFATGAVPQGVDRVF